jgi:uncharacterized membrane protein
MSRFILSLILFLAGLLHLLMPQLFDSAIPFEYKWPINLFSGFFEIFLAFGLWIPKLKDRSTQLTAIWFLILIPIHIYVAWNEISIFGISSPFLLWGRTLFQPVLIFWALSLHSKGVNNLMNFLHIKR